MQELPAGSTNKPEGWAHSTNQRFLTLPNKLTQWCPGINWSESPGRSATFHKNLFDMLTGSPLKYHFFHWQVGWILRFLIPVVKQKKRENRQSFPAACVFDWKGIENETRICVHYLWSGVTILNLLFPIPPSLFFFSLWQENPFLFLYSLLWLICSSRALFLIWVWDEIRPRRRVPLAGKTFFLLIFYFLLALPSNKGFFSFPTRESSFQMESWKSALLIGTLISTACST